MGFNFAKDARGVPYGSEKNSKGEKWRTEGVGRGNHGWMRGDQNWREDGDEMVTKVQRQVKLSRAMTSRLIGASQCSAFLFPTSIDCNGSGSWR